MKYFQGSTHSGRGENCVSERKRDHLPYSGLGLPKLNLVQGIQPNTAPGFISEREDEMIPNEQVTSLERLIELVKERRSVQINYGWPAFKCKPAAFIVNMSGTIIQRMFNSGMYVYEKEDKK